MYEESKSFPADAAAGPWPKIEEKGCAARHYELVLGAQVAVAYILIEAALWTRPGRLETTWILLAAVCVLLSTLASSFSAKDMGLAFPTPAASRRIVLSGIILAAAIPLCSMLVDYHAGPAHVLPLRQATQYAVWAVVQQFILQSFFYVRLESLLGGRRAVWATAALFGATHIPSPVLTVVSLLGGLFFCEMFRRYRNIFPLGLAHAFLGLVIAASFSDALLHHMRVGEGYLNFHH
jgi:membrane protease YdiL (CAAX protease family)